MRWKTARLVTFLRGKIDATVDFRPTDDSPVGPAARPAFTRRNAPPPQATGGAGLLMLDDDDVQRASQGDRSAFERIVRATYSRTLRIARRVLAHEADANDVVQEAYTRAFVALREGRFRGEGPQFQAWLDRIVVRAALDALRQRVRTARRVDQHADFAEATDDGRSDPARAMDAKRALEAIRELSPEQRAAFVLRELEGLSIKEAAAALETTDGAIEQRVLRAWASLRRRLSS